MVPASTCMHTFSAMLSAPASRFMKTVRLSIFLDEHSRPGTCITRPSVASAIVLQAPGCERLCGDLEALCGCAGVCCVRCETPPGRRRT